MQSRHDLHAAFESSAIRYCILLPTAALESRRVMKSRARAGFNNCTWSIMDRTYYRRDEVGGEQAQHQQPHRPAQ